MAEVFEAKVRRIGNSLGIIIPNEIIQAAGYDDGDTIHVSIPHSNLAERNKLLLAIAGKYKGKEPFMRDKEDRY